MALAGEVIDHLVTVLPAHPAGLTEREIEVLRLVADGLDNSAIADHLVVSPRTVHAHLRSVYAKLGVGTRTAAAPRGSASAPRLISAGRGSESCRLAGS